MTKHNNLNYERIMDFIRKNKVVTTGEVAEFLKISWNTANSWLLNLALKKKIELIKKEGGLNLWLKK